MHPHRRTWLKKLAQTAALPLARALGQPAALGNGLGGAFAALATLDTASAATAQAPAGGTSKQAPDQAPDKRPTSASTPETNTAAPAPSIDADSADWGDSAVSPSRTLRFARDHGAHLGAGIEWWYATGWLGSPQAPSHGFQVTFFRSATGFAKGLTSRFAARHLLFAHAALTTLPGTGPSPRAGQHRHDQRLARWSGAPDAALARAALDDADVRLGDWSLRRKNGVWLAQVPTSGFTLNATLVPTQALLLQGQAGHSRKGPLPTQASHYYSEPQLAAQVLLKVNGQRSAQPLQGLAWLDHEWSSDMLHQEAVGWDWLGINLFDGSTLTAFVLRRADGSAVWAGGSHRSPGKPTQSFAPHQVHLQALRRWVSPSSGANYPVAWTVDCPAGRFTLQALLDAQELDGSASTGTVYWEGLSELLDASRQRVGLGYLEMTGYAGRLQLGLK